jgi:ferrous iron transport protein B
MTQARPVVTNIPVPRQLLRGERRPHIALVGLPRGGKSTLFQAASSTAVEAGCLEGSALPYATSRINVGLE